MGYNCTADKSRMISEGTMRVLMASAILAASLAMAVPESGQAAHNMLDEYQVSKWLEGIGLDKYIPVFRRHDITLSIIPKLTDSDLREMGIDSIGARLRILEAAK